MVKDDTRGIAGRPEEAAVRPPCLGLWGPMSRRGSPAPFRSYGTKRNSGELVSIARRVRHPHRGWRVNREATGKGQAR